MNLIKMNDTSLHMYPQFFPVMQYLMYIKISFKISRKTEVVKGKIKNMLKQHHISYYQVTS